MVGKQVKIDVMIDMEGGKRIKQEVEEKVETSGESGVRGSM